MFMKIDTKENINSIFDRNGVIESNGLAHTCNPAHLKPFWYNNYPHRSVQEVLFHKALRWRQTQLREDTFSSFIFSPLTTFYGGHRIETDFQILKDTFTLITEIDGDSHREKLAIEEKERLETFEDNGFIIYRIRCDANSDMNWAYSSVDKALARLDKIIKIGR